MSDIVINKVQSIQRCLQRARDEFTSAAEGFATKFGNHNPHPRRQRPMTMIAVHHSPFTDYRLPFTFPNLHQHLPRFHQLPNGR